MSTKNKRKPKSSGENEKFPLPIYKKEEDIYNQEKKESLEDEDQPRKKQLSQEGKNIGGDPDIPGAEIDDADEEIGEEDEENNYYSLGGENHEDLEEDNN